VLRATGLISIEHCSPTGVSGGNRWFPGLLFEASAQGGTAASSLGRSLRVGGLLALGADADAVAASTTFVRVST